MSAPIRIAAVSAGLILAVAVMLRLWAHAAAAANQAELSTRGVNLLIALTVIVTANAASKPVSRWLPSAAMPRPSRRRGGSPPLSWSPAGRSTPWPG